MATEGNNFSQEYENTRESFFTEGERDRFLEVLQNPYDRQLHYDLLKSNAKELHNKAMDLIERAEAGEFNEEGMLMVEYAISHYLAAIEDVHLELIKERSLSDDDLMVR
jgi:hypothetical protein